MLGRRSQRLYQRAIKKIPGGVNSPVRAWKAVGGSPLFVKRGERAYIFDADGKKYVDFVGSWGPLILGHAHPRIVTEIQKAVRSGITFGAPTERELELAALVTERMPSIEKVRLVNSGTEAAMSALRLARAYTKRTKIIKFDGCYHGHSDGLLARAGSGVATLTLPDSAGVPPAFTTETFIASFNDAEGVAAVFERHGTEIAALIVEPVCGNMGVIPPKPGFLAALSKVTRQYGALLIFDEVITGFRLAAGGAQELYEVTPDLTCLGKILGGGLPLAAFGGRREIMDLLAPEGPVYQAGTLSGNPVAVAAGLATLTELSRRGTYAQLEKKGKMLQQGYEDVLKRYQLSGVINQVGSMLTVFFGVDRVGDANEARQCDRERFIRFFHGMLKRGIYLPPSPFEAAFISLAHSDADLNRAIKAFSRWAAEETKRLN